MRSREGGDAPHQCLTYPKPLFGDPQNMISFFKVFKWHTLFGHFAPWIWQLLGWDILVMHRPPKAGESRSQNKPPAAPSSGVPYPKHMFGDTINMFRILKVLSDISETNVFMFNMCLGSKELRPTKWT